MSYKLKNGIEAFTVVDGEFEGRGFKPGILYGEIPPQEVHKFEEVKEEAKPEADAPKGRQGSKKAASEASPEKEGEL